MKKIATHNKTFHCDEITAIALLKLFTDEEYTIHRLDHETDNFEQYDFVIDIGRKFDGKKYFDHHQYKGGKSSAGLIWEYLGEGQYYPRISKLIDAVDRNDTGVEKAKEFEYSSLMKAFNQRSTSSKEQEEYFYKALEFALTVLGSLKRNQEDYEDAKDIVKNSFLFDKNQKIIELESFNPHWGSFINGITTPNIKAVVWEDEDEENWKVKITSKYPGSFELNYKPFKPDSSMDFVHSSGHFAVAKNEETLQVFLRKHIQ
jgi:uncharacterized UPF0160 family protein